MISLKKWLLSIVIPTSFLLLPVTAFAFSTGIPVYTSTSSPPYSTGLSWTAQFQQTLSSDFVFSGISLHAYAYVDYDITAPTSQPINMSITGSPVNGCTFVDFNALDETVGHHSGLFQFDSAYFNGSTYVPYPGCDLSHFNSSQQVFIYRHTSQAQINYIGGTSSQYGNYSTRVDNAGTAVTGIFNMGFEFTDASPISSTTRIVSFTPEEGTTTGNDVTFNLHAYINPDDLGTILGIQLDYHNIDQNSLLSNIPLVTNDVILFAGQATTSGDFYFTATSSLPDGNYRVQASIKRTLANTFVNPFSSINDTENHQYVVNQGTYIGHLNQNGFTEFNSIFASSSATSTAAAAGNCNPVSFNVSLCLAFLFVPGGPQLDQTVQSFQDGIATRMPWGYFYRIYHIFSQTGSTSLPTYTADIVIGPPDNLATTSLTYDPGDMINGAAALLGTIHDNQNGKSFRDVMEPFVQLTIALAVIFGIFADVTGSHKHHTQVKSGKSGKLS